MPQLLVSPPRPASKIQLLLALAAATVITEGRAAVFTWDNSAGTSLWSTPANWAGDVEPDATGNVIFPEALAGTIILGNVETASRLQFDGSYTLSGGSLNLGSVDEIQVAAGATGTIYTPLFIGGQITKSGSGTLVLYGSNTNPYGFVVASGTLQVGNPLGLHQTSAGQPTRVAGGATLDVATSIIQRLSLADGATLASSGTGATRNVTTIDAAASSINLTTFVSAGQLVVGENPNDLTGGSTATVINVNGPGTVRLNESNNFDGSWNVASGSRLEIWRANSLGDRPESGVTLAGGTLAARSDSSKNFTTSPGNHITLTADSALSCDTFGSTAAYRFGTLAMGSHTLNVIKGGFSSSDGTIALNKAELSGNPTFTVQGQVTLGIDSLSGGASPRQITKTGAGNLFLTGGSSALAAGSSLSASGGTLGLFYPPLGSAATVVTTPVQNPLGTAPLSLNGSVLRLQADSGASTAAQTFVLPTAVSLAGQVAVEPKGAVENTAINKTFELPSITFGAGSTLTLDGSNKCGLRIAGGLVMEGNATLQGSGRNFVFDDCQLTLAGGIQSAPSSVLTIAPSNTPLALAVTASSTRSGSTIINGGNVTLSAANAFGTGPLQLGGGRLTLAAANAITGGFTSTGGELVLSVANAVPGNLAFGGGTLTLSAANAIPGNLTLTGGTLLTTTDDAVGGSVQVQGGTLRITDTDAFEGNGIQLNGGTLDLRSENSATFLAAALGVSGNSTLSLSSLSGGSSGSGNVKTLTLPLLVGSSDAMLTLAPAFRYIPLFNELQLTGNFALNVPADTIAKVQTITEGAGGPWNLTKAGGGTLQLLGSSLRPGSTTVEAGTLQLSDSGALGSGILMLGAAASTAAATANFDGGLVIPNAIATSLPPAGGGVVKIASPAGGVTWLGPILAQRELTIENTAIDDSTISGKIEGPGLITKTGGGEIFLSNPLNDFTGGLKIQAGSLNVAQDAALGSTAVPVQLAGGYLSIAESFSSNRTLALSGVANTGVIVAEGRDFSFGGQITGTAKFIKTGDGTMTFLPGVDNSARGNATTMVGYGTLRIQGLNNLSANGPIEVFGYPPHDEYGTAEFLADANTVYPYPVIANNGAIRVDRSLGGSTVNGRHTLGPVSFTNNSNLRVSGGHGYGLSLGPVTALGGGTLWNQAEAPLIVDSVEGKSSALGFVGPGEIRINGALTRQPGGDNFFLSLHDARLKLGTSAPGFNGALRLNHASVLDTNNLSLAATAVNFGLNDESPETPSAGSRIEMGSGTLSLSSVLALYSLHNPALVHGHVDLGNATRSFISAPVSSSGLNQPGDAILTVDGPITGSGTAGIVKSGGAIVRMTGAGNTFPGALKVTAGEVQLGKSSGLAVGAGGLQVDMESGAYTAGVTLLADEQIEDSVPLSLSGVGPTPDYYYVYRNAFVDLGNHTETVGPLSLSYSGSRGTTHLKIGPQGKLVLNGNLSFTNKIIVPTGAQDVMISGQGTLDLGGVVRTIDVSSTAPAGPEKDEKNATIEAKVTNGGILKTGKQTLFLTNPGNQFPLGIVVQEGFIGPGAAGSLGSSPVTFTNGPGVLAGYDFGMASGVQTGDLTIAGASNTEIRHTGTGSEAKFTGAITLEKDLVVNVADGPDLYSEGLLYLAGGISDGPGTFNLIKKGDGILKLGPANAYSGTTTVQRGSLWVTGPGSLGDGNAPLVIDGGCLMASNGSVVLPRDITFTANGGGLRTTYYGEDEVWPTLELTGHVDWGSGITGSFGIAGTTILSGTTAGTGDFQLGVPTNFGVGASTVYGYGHCLSLRGPAALPSGNLRIDHEAVLELGNGDFTRGLGTGPGQVQITGSGGWAAYGAERTVNIGGAGATLLWGQANPPFLYSQEGNYFSFGDLVLGSSTATHTVNFVNPLTVPVHTPSIVTQEGPAAIDARINGDLTLNTGDPDDPASLGMYGAGTLEITGDLRGDFDIYQELDGTTIFRGANEAREMTVFLAKWIFATPEGLGSPRYFSVYASEVDVSALPNGLVIHPEGEIDLYGDITGDVTVPASMYGSGTISGDLLTGAHSLLKPEMYGELTVGGDFSLVSGATLRFEFPDYTSGGQVFGLGVAGGVSLQGSLELEGVRDYFEVGKTYTLIANAGNDPIQGSFQNLPEGSVIPVGGGYGFRISYQANGDGGAVGNDLGITVIALADSADHRITASAPVSVEPGAEIAIRYQLANSGESAGTGTLFQLSLPAGVGFIGAEPAGEWNAAASTFTLALPGQAPGSTADLVVRFSAPAAPVPAAVNAAASYRGSLPDETPATLVSTTAVLVGGRPATPRITRDPAASPDQQIQVTLDTIEGVRYVSEASYDLIHWYQIGFVTGDGGPHTAIYTYQQDYTAASFFRYRVVPAAVPVPP